MAAALSIEINASRLKKALDRAPAEFRERMDTVLLRLGIAHENVVKRRQFGPYRGRAYAGRLQRRSGALANSYALIRGRGQITAAMRKGMPGSKYAKMQEFGGTIRPKSGKYLTVPLKTALTPSGVLSGKYKIRRAADGFRTDAGPTFIYEKGGKLFVAIRRGNRVLPLYILKDSVTVKPRLGFFGTWDLLERSLLPKLIARETRAVMKGGARA